MLDSHPAVVESAVGGSAGRALGGGPRRLRGARREDVDADALAEYARERLARYKVPKRIRVRRPAEDFHRQNPEERPARPGSMRYTGANEHSGAVLPGREGRAGYRGKRRPRRGLRGGAGPGRGGCGAGGPPPGGSGGSGRRVRSTGPRRARGRDRRHRSGGLPGGGPGGRRGIRPPGRARQQRGLGTAVPALHETPEQFRRGHRRQPARRVLDGPGRRAASCRAARPSSTSPACSA